jgi:hypothetical protein
MTNTNIYKGYTANYYSPLQLSLATNIPHNLNFFNSALKIH